MNEQIARGLPPIDDEYRGPSWWHLSRLAEVPRSAGMRRIALLGLTINAVAIATGIMEVVWGWGGLPIRVGSLDLAVTVYPPFILSLLAAVWLGPTWGLVPAYAANLAGALVSGLDPVPAVLFALAGALEVLIFWGSMVTLNIDPDLKRRQDLMRFVGVSIIAPTTASLAVLIRNSAQGLSLTDGRQVWLGWVIGDVLQALFVVVPLLYFTGPTVRSWIDRQFAAPPRYEVTYTRAAIIAATTFALIAMLTFVGIYMLQDSLDLDPATLTRSGELLLPRLQEMQMFLGLLVVVLTLTTGIFSTVLGRMGERQRSLSRRESLTGCFNRRAFYELFPREAERARRLGQACPSCSSTSTTSSASTIGSATSSAIRSCSSSPHACRAPCARRTCCSDGEGRSSSFSSGTRRPPTLPGWRSASAPRSRRAPFSKTSSLPRCTSP